MDKYNAILNKLLHTAPIVTDPEGLTQRIMKEIEQPVIRRRSKIRIIMTGIAASVLSVWMIDEINYRFHGIYDIIKKCFNMLFLMYKGD